LKALTPYNIKPPSVIDSKNVIPVALSKIHMTLSSGLPTRGFVNDDPFSLAPTVSVGIHRWILLRPVMLNITDYISTQTTVIRNKKTLFSFTYPP